MRPDRIIVGEVRGTETIDMIQAMSTGHRGSLSTGHSDSPRDMLRRLETMVLMGMDIPLAAIQRQIASAIDIIIHVGRLRDRSRKVLEIVEVLDYEDGEIQTGCLYEFQETKCRKTDGVIEGRWQKVRPLLHTENYFQQDIRPHEYLFAILKYAGFLALVSWLYYESVWAFFFCAPGIFLYLRHWKKECLEKKKREFALQFQEAIRSLAASLNVGYSLENAIKETKKDINILYSEQTAIHREFDYMIRQIYLQIPMDQILYEWAQRVDQEDLHSFVSVFVAAKKSGGDSLKVIRDSISQIRDKMEMQREIDTILAARKYECKVMSVIPFGLSHT